MFKINKKKTLEKRQSRDSGVFVVNFEHVSHLSLVFLLLTFKQVNVCWEFWNFYLVVIIVFTVTAPDLFGVSKPKTGISKSSTNLD